MIAQKKDCEILPLLRSFYFIAVTGSVSGAAKQLDLNQPAVSHQLRNLENSLGRRLFRRTRQGMELTAEGHTLFQRAIRIFDIAREIRSLLGKDEEAASVSLSLGAINAFAVNLLPQALQRFLASHPQTKFTITSSSASELVTAIAQAKIDFAFLRARPMPEGLLFKELFKSRLMLLGHESNPLCETGTPSLAEIARMPFIRFAPESDLARLIDERFQQDGLALKHIQDHSHLDAILRYVKMGLGVSIVDSFFIPEDQGFITIPLGDYFPQQVFGLAVRTEKHLSGLAGHFMRFILAIDWETQKNLAF